MLSLTVLILLVSCNLEKTNALFDCFDPLGELFAL